MLHKGLKRTFRLVPVLLALAAPSLAQSGDDVVGPGEAPVDVFHPDRERPAEPRYGGRVIVHIDSLPKNICYPIETSAITRRILYAVHETLLVRDWEWHDYRPRVAREYVAEDMLVLSAEAAGRYEGAVDVELRVPPEDVGDPSEHEVEDEAEPPRELARVLYGAVTGGDGTWRVEPRSQGNPLAEALDVPAADVARVERGTVYTVRLRDDVRWHPSLVFQERHPEAYRRLLGHTVDARDVRFSWSIYSNPALDCDEKRYIFSSITDCQVVDPSTVRFFFEGQYFKSLDAFGTSLTILPSHVYDLSDPDNPDFREHFTDAEQAEHIEGNPHNRLWVGVGPYRVTRWTQQYVQAERFTDEAGHCLYFDRDDAGYVDTIRWRCIPDDEVAMNAVLNGELDYFEAVKSSDYLGGRADKEPFTRTHYKGLKYLGTYGYTGWNLYKPQLADLAVRKAIAMAFDFDAYKATYYEGLGRQVTGPFPYNSGAYDHSVKPFPHDVGAARDLLDEAGWYDRDGDGVRDKDGVKLELDFLMPAGSTSSMNFGLVLQETLAQLEIKVNIVQMEWATLLEKVKSRQFDCTGLAWMPPLEPDPEQIWHSRWGARDKPSSNNAGVTDPHVDELIERGQRELDPELRMEIWHALHRYLYEEVQPYLFLYNVPQKYAMNKKIRGFQAVAIDPGYVIRRWYYSDPEDAALRDTLDR